MHSVKEQRPGGLRYLLEDLGDLEVLHGPGLYAANTMVEALDGYTAYSCDAMRFLPLDFRTTVQTIQRCAGRPRATVALHAAHHSTKTAIGM